MGRKLKNFFSVFVKLRKMKFFSGRLAGRSRWFRVLLIFIALGLVLPLRLTYAAILGDLAVNIANSFFLFAFSLVIGIGDLILQFGLLILNWVLSDNFINFSYTGLDNPIIQVGWTLTRDLANMAFVIILVFIGLGTALRLGEYQAKKTLPLLIGIGLLINFTPVICGVIVDASNIIMNFFLAKLSGFDVLGRTFEAQRATIAQTLKGAAILSIIPALFQTIILVIFDLLAAIIFLLFAALFAMRYVAIWMLVILSPFAFACYILPATKGVFTAWWNQFIQWSIIGITAAFFIYLGNHIMVNTDKIIGAAPPGGDFWAQPWLAFLKSIMPYGVALAFLCVGFFASLSTGAMGASAVINAAQKGGKAAVKGLGKYSAGVARGIPAVSRAEERIRKRLETTPGISGLVGGSGAYEREKSKKMDELGKPYEKLPPGEIRKVLRSTPITYEDKLKQAKLFDILREKGELSDTERGYLPMAQRMGLDMGAILKRRPDWAPNILDPTTGHPMTIDQTMAKMEPEEFRKDTQTEALSDPEVVLRAELDERKFREMELRGKTTKKRAIINTILTGALPPHVAAALTPAELTVLHARHIQITTSPNWRV